MRAPTGGAFEAFGPEHEVAVDVHTANDSTTGGSWISDVNSAISRSDSGNILIVGVIVIRVSVCESSEIIRQTIMTRCTNDSLIIRRWSGKRWRRQFCIECGRIEGWIAKHMNWSLYTSSSISAQMSLRWSCEIHASQIRQGIRRDGISCERITETTVGSKLRYFFRRGMR